MKAEDLISYYKTLKSQKEPFDVLYQDVADYFCPYSGDFNRLFGKAENRQRYFINQDAQHALDISASSLLGLTANPASRWFTFELTDEKLNRDVGLVRYLDEAGQTLLNYFNNPDAMFYAHYKTALIETVAFGTPTMQVRFNDEGEHFEFAALPLCNVVVAEGVNGAVDVVMHEKKMTYRQIMQKDNQWDIHKDTRKFAEEKPFDDTEVLFVYMPREGGKADAVAKDKLPIAEYVIDKKTNHIMHEDGYYEMPVRTARWMQVPGEVYGRSMAMIALSDARTLNEATRLFYDAAEKNVNPAVFLPNDNMMGNKVNFTANAVNFYDASKGKPEFMTGTADIGVIAQSIEALRASIRSLLMVDQLQLQGTATMTATEVMQRTDEKTRMLAPSLGRIQSELLSPLVERALNILIRKGLVDPMPEQLAGAGIKVIYSNQVQRAQRSGEVQNFMMAIIQFMQLAQVSPDVLDHLDLDRAVREGMDMLNVTSVLARDEKEVEAMREQRAQEQEAMMMAQQASMAGEAMGKVGEGINAIQGDAAAV